MYDKTQNQLESMLTNLKDLEGIENHVVRDAHEEALKALATLCIVHESIAPIHGSFGWYATVWDEKLRNMVKEYGPYESEGKAKEVATKLHARNQEPTAYEYRGPDGEVDGDVWPKVSTNR